MSALGRETGRDETLDGTVAWLASVTETLNLSFNKLLFDSFLHQSLLNSKKYRKHKKAATEEKLRGSAPCPT